MGEHFHQEMSPFLVQDSKSPLVEQLSHPADSLSTQAWAG